MISKITPEHVRNSESKSFSNIEQSIPFMGGRPSRDRSICADDIVNLIIACNTCSTLEDFFNKT